MKPKQPQDEYVRLPPYPKEAQEGLRRTVEHARKWLQAQLREEGQRRLDAAEKDLDAG